MPFTIDTDEDAYLKELVERAVQKGLRRGLEQGREQGLERGMEQGIHQGEVRFVLRSLEVRFGTLPEWVKTKVSEASTETLEAWVEHLHTANTIEDALR